MKNKRLILLVIFLPATLVLIVMGIVEMVRPKFVFEKPGVTHRASLQNPTETSRLKPTKTLKATNLKTPKASQPLTPTNVNAIIKTQTLALTTSKTLRSTKIPKPTKTSKPTKTPKPTKTTTPTVTPCLNCTSTPLFLSTMVSVMGDIAGNWYGISDMGVDHQARHNRVIKLTLYEGCTSGVVCGEYHDESTCSGLLTMYKMSGDTFIFASHPLGSVDKCNPAGYFYLKTKAGGKLSLTIRLTDLDGRRIVRSATLMR
jgi:hypothetical protein